MKADFLKAVKCMAEGVHDKCVDGKCIGCGECCGSLLPLSDREIQTIKRYIKKRGIKLKKYIIICEKNSCFNLGSICPFLDISKEKDKCLIYEARPDICRAFQCNRSPTEVFYRMREEPREVVNMWDLVR